MNRCGGFRVEHDVGGIAGLSIAYEVFNEETERYLFERGDFPSFESTQGRPSKRAQMPKGSTMLDSLEVSCMNAARDCGLIPSTASMANYCQSLTYQNGGTFSAHYDSRYRWGEYVVSVTIGAPASLIMSRAGHQSVTLDLPRRSIYAMHAPEARRDWKHQICRVDRVAGQAPAPLWATGTNNLGVRKSWTFRCTKTYDEVSMKRELAAAEQRRDTAASADLRLRLKAAAGLGPERRDSRVAGQQERYTAEDLASIVADAEHEATEVAENPITKSRFPLHCVNFLAPDGRAPSSRVLYVGGPLTQLSQGQGQGQGQTSVSGGLQHMDGRPLISRRHSLDGVEPTSTTHTLSSTSHQVGHGSWMMSIYLVICDRSIALHERYYAEIKSIYLSICIPFRP